jgi:hypothetical protein
MTQLLSIVELVVIGFTIGYGTKKALQAFDWLLEKWRQ